MGAALNTIFFIIGLLIFIIMITGILFVLVLPRQPTGVERATLVVNRAVRLFFLALSRLAKTYEQKDAILAPSAPVALIAQLLFWAATLVLGLGLMLMPTSWWRARSSGPQA